MITSLKYIPILIASVVMVVSFLFKVLFAADLNPADFIRDILSFFIVYYIVKTLLDNIARIFKNYWKIL